MGANESTVTISMEGQELGLPLDSLSAFSKALAIKLRKESKTIQAATPPVQIKSKPLYDWKDLQGRVIKAEFISANSSAVKILFNGQTVELSFSFLSQESKNLARQLAHQSEPLTKQRPRRKSKLQQPGKKVKRRVQTLMVHLTYRAHRYGSVRMVAH